MLGKSEMAYRSKTANTGASQRKHPWAPTSKLQNRLLFGLFGQTFGW